MNAELDALTAEVKATTELQASAVLLIQGLAQKIEAAKTDPVKLTELSQSLQNSAATLAAAISANTPAAPDAAPAEGGT